MSAAACVLDSSRTASAESLRGFESFTMAHPRLIEAKDELVQAIECSAPGSLILVLGPTGVGKTTLLRKVQQCLAERLAPQLESEAGQLPFVSVEAIAPDMRVSQFRQLQRVALPNHDGIHDGQTRQPGDVADHMMDLHIHLRQRFLHVLDMLAGYLHQIAAVPHQ